MKGKCKHCNQWLTWTDASYQYMRIKKSELFTENEVHELEPICHKCATKRLRERRKLLKGTL